jgi:hypothetical protein
MCLLYAIPYILYTTCGSRRPVLKPKNTVLNSVLNTVLKPNSNTVFLIYLHATYVSFIHTHTHTYTHTHTHLHTHAHTHTYTHTHTHKVYLEKDMMPKILYDSCKFSLHCRGKTL